MECQLFHEILRRTNIDHMKEPLAPDAAAPLVLCDMPKRMRRNTALEIKASDHGIQQHCMGRIFGWLRHFLEVQAAFNRLPVGEADRNEEQSRLCVSAAESRRLKRVAPPAESSPLARRAADGADAVDVPAGAIVPAVPSPYWWMQKERDEKPNMMMLTLEVEAEEFKTKNFNCHFPTTAKSVWEACSRPDYSFTPGIHERDDGCCEVGREMAARLVPALLRARGRHWYLWCACWQACPPARTLMWTRSTGNVLARRVWTIRLARLEERGTQLFHLRRDEGRQVFLSRQLRCTSITGWTIGHRSWLEVLCIAQRRRCFGIFSRCSSQVSSPHLKFSGCLTFEGRDAFAVTAIQDTFCELEK